MSGNEFNYDLNSKERVLYITLTNTFSEFDINGSVLSTLTILDQKGDTIGHERIKYIPPQFEKSQVYAVFIRKNYTKEISVKNITIALENYCEDLTITTNTITKLKRGSSVDEDKSAEFILTLVRLSFEILLLVARLN